MLPKTGLEVLLKLLKEMRPLLLKAGAPSKHLRINDKKKHRTDVLNRAFDWLHNLEMSEEFVVMTATLDLRPEKTWKNYELFGIDDLPEQILLKNAQKALLKKWRHKRPRIFGAK